MLTNGSKCCCGCNECDHIASVHLIISEGCGDLCVPCLINARAKYRGEGFIIALPGQPLFMDDPRFIKAENELKMTMDRHKNN